MAQDDFSTPEGNQFASRPRRPSLDNSQYINSIATRPSAGIASWNGMPSLISGAQAATPSGPTENALNSAQPGISSVPASQPAQNSGIASPPTNFSRRADFSDVKSSLAPQSIADISRTWNPSSTDATNGRGINQLMANGYGRVVNGTPTFSDGSAISGLPKTVSSDQLSSLSDMTNVASGQNMSNPGIGTLGTPVSQNQGVSAAGFNRGIAYYDPTEASTNLASDLASIASRDPRSTLGRASWNSYADDVWRRNTGQRQHGIGDLPQAAIDTFNAQNQAGNANARDQTQFGIAGLNSDSRLAAAEARADALSKGYLIKADATRDVATTNANSRSDVAKTNAGAKTTAAEINSNRPRIDATAQKQIGTIINDPNLNPEQKHQAIADYMETLSKYGLKSGNNPQPSPTQTGTEGASTSGGGPSQFDIKFLKDNPTLRDKFEARFGKGSADKALGN